jgi:hypothetical protein
LTSEARVNCMCNFLLPSSCKNFSQNGEPSEKLCLFYGRYLKLCFFEDTTRQIDQQLGHKFSLVCAMGNRQMNPRGAAVQGGRHKAARNLSRAGAARVHTRRLARASRVMGWIDLGSG